MIKESIYQKGIIILMHFTWALKSPWSKPKRTENAKVRFLGNDGKFNTSPSLVKRMIKL
jgi:hypothetical protein